MKYDNIHTVLDEGNFVLVVSEGHSADKHISFYDLFRVENGKIADIGILLKRYRQKNNGRTATVNLVFKCKSLYK